MQTNEIHTIADLAIAFPNAIPVFERLQIDYCCHGKRPIADACRGTGITTDELMRIIAIDSAATPASPDAASPLDGIAKFIVDTHHAYTRKSLQTMQMLAAKVRDAHGERHPELKTIATLAGELMADLIPHMLKEEQVLFPYINTLQEAEVMGTEPPVPFFATVKNPIRMMMLEHEVAGEKMAQLRLASMDFTAPSDACPSYRAFYALLEEFEADLHRHIHLENNVLFPRAATLEENISTLAAAAGRSTSL